VLLFKTKGFLQRSMIFPGRTSLPPADLLLKFTKKVAGFLGDHGEEVDPSMWQRSPSPAPEPTVYPLAPYRGLAPLEVADREDVRCPILGEAE
jgi:hypothetical protein